MNAMDHRYVGRVRIKGTGQTGDAYKMLDGTWCVHLDETGEAHQGTFSRQDLEALR